MADAESLNTDLRIHLTFGNFYLNYRFFKLTGVESVECQVSFAVICYEFPILPELLVYIYFSATFYVRLDLVRLCYVL